MISADDQLILGNECGCKTKCWRDSDIGGIVVERLELFDDLDGRVGIAESGSV